MNSVLSNFKETIFTTITELAKTHDAVNLGQGFPDFDGPEWIKNEAIKAINGGYNQYAPMIGAPALREALAHVYQEQYQVKLDPLSQITIHAGATEAIYVTLLALCNPGDEVIVFEPFYDSYIASIQLARAIPKIVTLKYDDNFSLDCEELARAITPKTKMILLNSPHNPTGKVFSKAELQSITTLAQKHNLYILSDEVYEYLTYSAKHLSLQQIMPNYKKIITISSAGKTFGLTGWKIGWTIADQAISKAIRLVRQFTTFAVSHPMQIAVAQSLLKLNNYLPEFQKSYTDKMTLFTQGIKNLGLPIQSPQGTYFCLLAVPEGHDDVSFCQKLIKEYKVAAIPPSAFYLSSNDGTRYVRFCFAKKEETLLTALERLKDLKKLYHH